MSTTATRRTLCQARADAEAFRDYFPPSFYVKWEIAGSVRRKKSEVSDVEHVVIPAFADEDAGGLFSERVKVNLLWRRLDELVANGILKGHVYKTVRGDQLRWGDKYRGVDFRGFNHEIFTADANNFGCQLLIRTGSADYSRDFVDRFLRGGLYRQRDGYLVHVKSGQIVPVPDEQTYFRMAGLPFVVPEKRT